MYDRPISELLDPKKVLIASAATRVIDAAKLMAKSKVSAVLVVEDGKLVGIFTERDAVHRVIAKRKDARLTTLAEVMTRDPMTASPDETFGYAMLLMHEHGFRHLPVVQGTAPVGIISARKALDPDLEEFVSEAQRRASIQRYARGRGPASRVPS
ncbi:MAG TPA: CBS domain-containing protein [Burkholderiales bacterium]|jgi:CBS domain-containing protein|nr:CBS domain-containing protein [Burkholderiales bacterium]